MVIMCHLILSLNNFLISRREGAVEKGRRGEHDRRNMRRRDEEQKGKENTNGGSSNQDDEYPRRHSGWSNDK